MKILVKFSVSPLPICPASFIRMHMRELCQHANRPKFYILSYCALSYCTIIIEPFKNVSTQHVGKLVFGPQQSFVISDCTGVLVVLSGLSLVAVCSGGLPLVHTSLRWLLVQSTGPGHAGFSFCSQPLEHRVRGCGA